MGFKTGDPKPLNSGRKRYVSNKLTRDIREMILAAARARKFRDSLTRGKEAGRRECGRAARTLSF
jgi:hypothetical protein